MFEPIGYIKTDLKEKFGTPRQSGLVPDLMGQIILSPPYNQAAFIKGIEQFEYIWVLWHFSKNSQQTIHATVRPPRLGGNEKVGVFASRSPFRPNGMGLSAVKLERVETISPDNVCLFVSGIDMVDQTPIFDIKPYIPYADAYPDARAGYVDTVSRKTLIVTSQVSLAELSPTQQAALKALLAQDPRPAYQTASDRVYGLTFDHYNVRFRVKNEQIEIVAINLLEEE